MKRAAIFAALLFGTACLPVRTQEPNPPDHVTKNYSLLPGKTLNLGNRTFHVVEIRSEYPVQLAAGPCHSDYTVQWRCKFQEPADLFIRDLRNPPVFATPRANAITVELSDPR